MNAILALGLALLALLVIVQGRYGLVTLLSILINLGLMILTVILIAGGFNPIIVSVIVGLLILATTIFMNQAKPDIAGPAFVASLLVMVIFVGLVMLVFHFSQTAGFGNEDGETLEGFSTAIGVSFQSILIATGLMSTLGAIAEAAIAVSAGLATNDIQPGAGQTAMLAEIIGTALNTLFFGFFGGFSALFIWFARLSYPFSQIINNKVFVGELLEVLLAVIAVIMTVPTTAWIVHSRQQRG